jgi:hypothetical protein
VGQVTVTQNWSISGLIQIDKNLGSDLGLSHLIGTINALRTAICGPAVRLVQGWSPSGRRMVDVRGGLGCTIQNKSLF